MGIFSQIKDKIFNRARKPQAADQQATTPVAEPTAASQPTPSPEPVDVAAVLAAMAEMQGGGGNYRTSIVDLLKLLQLDSSLDARKELATELGVNAGPAGSAEQNIALQKAVLQKLAENGGQVPDSFYQ